MKTTRSTFCVLVNRNYGRKNFEPKVKLKLIIEFNRNDSEGERMQKLQKRLTTMELAVRYGISVKTIDAWKRYEGFPHHAGRREGCRCFWDPEIVDAWLRKRLEAKKPSTSGYKPTWADLVR